MNDSARYERIGERCFRHRHIAEALCWFEKALRAGSDPRQNALLRWESWMLLGEFERAWKESDLVHGRRLSVPAEELTIHCCRGLGDAIQFLRFVPQLKMHCDKVTVHAPARLVPLLAWMPGIDEAAAICDAERTEVDLECSDLPYIARTSLCSLPGIPTILVPDAERERCDARLRTSSGLNIGLAWAAGEWNPSRSIPTAELNALFEIPGVDWFSLQRPHDDVLRHLTALETPGSDILATALNILNLDLVISVDTMVAHLAGALGKPVWLLLQHHADWRWMLGREDSPWYPTMRIFRQQPCETGWREVIGRVAAEIRVNPAGAFPATRTQVLRRRSSG